MVTQLLTILCIFFLIYKTNKIDMETQEALTKLTDLNTQVNKIKGEVQKLIDAANNTNGEIPEDVAAAIDSLAATIQGVDDLNPDEVTEPAPPEDETPVENPPTENQL